VTRARGGDGAAIVPVTEAGRLILVNGGSADRFGAVI
jgi:hypothetical protein